MGQRQRTLLQAYLCINVPVIAICLWYNISFSTDLLPLVGTIVGVLGALLGLQQKDLTVTRFVMYLAIFAASVVQAVAVILLWSRMKNVLSADCVQIECYQEVSLSSTQTSCEAETGKDWDITCYGYKDYTELPKAVHCGKLWCSDGFEDASEEKGPYNGWYEEGDCNGYWDEKAELKRACLMTTAIALLVSLFFIFVVLVCSLFHMGKDSSNELDADEWSSPTPQVRAYMSNDAAQEARRQGRQQRRPAPRDFHHHNNL